MEIYTVITESWEVLYSGKSMQNALKAYQNDNAFQILWQKEKGSPYHNLNDVIKICSPQF